MGIVDFFMPKWKRRNPETRLHAVQEMSFKTEPSALKELAATDPDMDVRVAAVLKIDDADCLREISEVNSDRDVADVIWKRFNLICSEMIIKDPERHMDLLDRIDDEDILTSVAIKTENSTLRIRIVNRISDERCLCRISENNCGYKAGELIVNKLSTRESLEFTAGKASNKRVRKLAREKISEPGKKESQNKDKKKESSGKTPILPSVMKTEQVEINISGQTVEILSKLCEDMEEICKTSSVSDKSMAESLMERWNSIDKTVISPEILSELQTRFYNKAESYNKKLSEYVKKKEREKILSAELRALCGEAESLLNSGTDKPQWTDLKRKWESVYTETPATVEINKVFREILKKKEIISHDLLKSRLEDLCLTVEKAVDQLNKKKSHFELVRSVKNAQKTWRSLNGASAAKLSDLNRRFKNSCSQFFEKHSEHVENHQWELWANLKKKEELIKEAENIRSGIGDSSLSQPYAIASGARSILSRWKKIGPAGRDEKVSIRFSKLYNEICQPCIDYKSSLHERVEDLSQSENWNDGLETLNALTGKWKSIGNLFTDRDKELNISFKRACDDFYRNRREFFQRRDEKRAANIEIKKEICLEAEKLRDSKNFTETVNRLKVLQKKWKETGPAPHKEEKKLWERFRKPCDYFFERFELVKNENLQVKEELCRKAELIDNLPDSLSELEKTRKEILNLQKKWKETGPAPHKEEKILWERFRKPCDDFFMHRKDLFLKMEPVFQKNMDILNGYIKEAEAISSSPDLKDAKDRVKELQKLWKLSGPVHPNEERRLNARFRKTCDVFFTNSRKKFREISRERDRNLKIKQDICLEVETIGRIMAPGSALPSESEVPMAEQLNMALGIKDEIHVEGDPRKTAEKAFSKVKKLKLKWKNTGPVPKKKADEIYMRFIKAVDRVYRSNNKTL